MYREIDHKEILNFLKIKQLKSISVHLCFTINTVKGINGVICTNIEDINWWLGNSGKHQSGGFIKSQPVWPPHCDFIYSSDLIACEHDPVAISVIRKTNYIKP